MVLEELVRDGVPRLRKIWADTAYSGEKLITWIAGLRAGTPVELEIVPRKKGQEGFEVLPWRWIVERTFGWLGRYRRMSKEYDVLPATTEAFMRVAMIKLMLGRLTTRPPSQRKEQAAREAAKRQRLLGLEAF